MVSTDDVVEGDVVTVVGATVLTTLVAIDSSCLDEVELKPEPLAPMSVATQPLARSRARSRALPASMMPM